MRIAIMGAGSLGTILGAYITKAGYQVDLIDAYKEHVDALNEKGAHVVGTVDFVQKVHAITPDQMEGVYRFDHLHGETDVQRHRHSADRGSY